MKDKAKVFKTVMFSALGVLLAALIFFCGYFTFYLTLSDEDKYMLWALDMIGDHYMMYDEETGELVEYAPEDYVKALAAGLGLDDYSLFYTAAEYSDVVATSQGNQYGVGVSFLQGETGTKIYAVTGNSPADRAGVKAGGEITAVEIGGTKTQTPSYEAFAEAIADLAEGENFTLYVDYGAGEIAYEVKKERFKQSYVRYADSETGLLFRGENGETPQATEVEEEKLEFLPEDTGYINYSSFMYTSAEQFETALSFLLGRGRSKLILDLRGNGGGYMDVLTEMASFFIDNGKEKNTVAIARAKTGKEQVFSTSENNAVSLREVVVLADGGSASASECLIGALLFYGVIDDAHLVLTEENGRAATFGKGIMQTTYVNPSFGGALKLTTAYIYWPDGETCIHGKGIQTAEAQNRVPSQAEGDAQLLRAAEILS